MGNRLILADNDMQRQFDDKKMLKTIVVPIWWLWQDLTAAMQEVRNKQRGAVSIMALFASVVLLWFLYVPVHELLHAMGCIITGGEVWELTLSSQYGGTILKKVIPFIRVDNEYAGRLTGFSTNGSDIVYLATVFMPYVLTIFMAAWCLRKVRHCQSILLLFSGGLILSTVPFISITGDFFEIGSIIVTALFKTGAFSGLGLSDTVLLRFRSDDLFRLFREMWIAPVDFGMVGILGYFRAAGIVLLTLLISVFSATWTYGCSRCIALFAEKND